jgi:hypothetical protein
MEMSCAMNGRWILKKILTQDADSNDREISILLKIMEQTTYSLIHEDDRYSAYILEKPATSTLTEDHETGDSRFLQSAGSPLTDYNLYFSYRIKLQFINVTSAQKFQ